MEICTSKKLAYPHGTAEVESDETGVGQLIFWFGTEGKLMVFRIKNRADWELFRRSWRIIRRYGSVKIFNSPDRFVAEIFAVDGHIHEAERP